MIALAITAALMPLGIALLLAARSFYLPENTARMCAAYTRREVTPREAAARQGDYARTVTP